MSEVVVSPFATRQFERLMDRLYAWGVRAYGGSEGAELYLAELLDEFEAKLDALAQMPESFPLVYDEDLARLGYRHFIVREQIVAIYRLAGETPRITCIYDPHTDYQGALRLDLRNLREV